MPKFFSATPEQAELHPLVAHKVKSSLYLKYSRSQRPTRAWVAGVVSTSARVDEMVEALKACTILDAHAQATSIFNAFVDAANRLVDAARELPHTDAKDLGKDRSVPHDVKSVAFKCIAGAPEDEIHMIALRSVAKRGGLSPVLSSSAGRRALEARRSLELASMNEIIYTIVH
jgi:hypothetical protein